jgi:hypothetical protein
MFGLPTQVKIMNKNNEDQSKKSWANTKLGLLIIGAIISGILIPTFQYTQRFFEWRRQNQYNSYSENLQNKKLLLSKFIESMSHLAESHEILIDFYISKDKINIDRNKLLEKLTHIQAKRFQVNTEISFLILLTGNNKIKTEFTNFLKINQEYIYKSKKIITELNDDSISKETFDDLKNNLSNIQTSFDLINDVITKNIKETIDENKNFRLF